MPKGDVSLPQEAPIEVVPFLEEATDMVNKSLQCDSRLLAALAAATFLYSPSAFATTPHLSGVPIVDGVISTVLYGFIGLGMAALSFRVIDGLTPGDLKQQLTVEKNIALGIVVGLQALGLSIIIAAAIAG
jgi:uncharacterized membrane protein YjfL (UPF0719 family)